MESTGFTSTYSSNREERVNTLFSEIEVRDSRIPIYQNNKTMSKGQRRRGKMCME